MNEIKCPQCATAFQIDEAGYADIQRQVRDQEFEKQLRERLLLAEKDKQSAVELTKQKAVMEQQQTAAEKDAQILALKAKIDAADVEKKLAITEALAIVEKERDSLKNQITTTEYQKQLSENSLREGYENKLKDQQEIIERLKDMKARLSTKMVGETLEQHCETEFNRIRAAGFPRAHFEKDNDARSGSKGDYIFRDFDDNKVEIVSIMFEMKNESDTEQCLGKT